MQKHQNQSHSQTGGCFPFVLLFLSNQGAPSLRKVLLSLAGEQRLREVNNPETRRGRQPGRRQTKLTPSKNTKVFKTRALMCSPLPEACQTQGFEKERKKENNLICMKGAKNNLAFSCRRKQKTRRFPPIWMFFSLGCGQQGEPLSSRPAKRQQAKTLRQEGDNGNPAEKGAPRV